MLFYVFFVWFTDLNFQNVQQEDSATTVDEVSIPSWLWFDGLIRLLTLDQQNLSDRGELAVTSTLQSPAAHNLTWQAYRAEQKAKQAARQAAAAKSRESEDAANDGKPRRAPRADYAGQCDSGDDDSDDEFDNEAPEAERRRWGAGSRGGGGDPNELGGDEPDDQPAGDEADDQPAGDEPDDQPAGDEHDAENDESEEDDEHNDEIETHDDDVGLQDMPIVDYEITKGGLSKSAKKEADLAKEEYQTKIRGIARREGKTVSSVLRAIGELPVALRSNNSWNAHQVEYRLKHPKPHNSKFSHFYSW